MKNAKTVYIASRTSQKETVRGYHRKFINLGFEIAEDWTRHKNVKPYSNNVRLSKKYALADIKAITKCDIFILITDKQGTGMYTELGVAIATAIITKKPKIYVLGKHSNLMFYYHPAVRRVDTIDEIIKEIIKNPGR